MQKIRKFLLRGYIEQVAADDFFAICITLNVCSRGKSMDEAEKNLNEAVTLYLGDIEEGQFHKWFPRHAPFYHQFRYACLWFSTRISLLMPSYDVLLTSRLMNA